MASSTDGNWWPDIILCIMGSLFSAAGADLAHVSCCAESTCGSAGTQKKGKKEGGGGDIRRGYNKCIFYVSLLFTKKEVGMQRSLQTTDEERHKPSAPCSAPTGQKGAIHMCGLLIIPAFEHYLWSDVIIHIESTAAERNTKAKGCELTTSSPWEMSQLERPRRDKSMARLGR